MADDAISSLSFDASGAKRGAEEFQAAGRGIIAANRAIEESEARTATSTTAAQQKKSAARQAAATAAAATAQTEIAAIAGAADVVAKSTDRVVVSLGRQQQTLDRVARAVDPLGAAMRKAQKDVDDLNRIITDGGPKAADATRLLAAAEERLAQTQRAVTLAANDNAKSLGDTAAAAGRLNPVIEQIAAKYGVATHAADLLREAQERVAAARLPAAPAVVAAAGSATPAAVVTAAAAPPAAPPVVPPVIPPLGRTATASVAPIDPAVVKSFEELARAQSGMAASAQRLRDELNPLGAIQRNYNAQVAEYNKLLAAGEITITEHGQALQRARAASDTAATAIRGVGAASKLSYTDIEVLRAGVVNTVQSLAGGVGVVRTFETQLFQIAPALPALVRNFGGLAIAVAAIGGPLALAAGAIALVGARIYSIQESMRGFQVQLETIGKTSPTTAAELQSVVEQLRNTGSSAEEARKAVQGLVSLRPQGFVPSAANVQQIATIGRDVAAGAQRGTTGADEAIALGKAIAGGVEEVNKYANALGALRPEQLKNIEDLRRAGEVNKAVAIAIAAIEAQVKGAHDRALTPFARAIQEVSTQWNRLLDDFARSNFGKFISDQLLGIVSGLKSTLDEIERLIALAQKVATLPGRAVSAVTSAVTGATPTTVPPVGQISGETRFDTRGLDTNTEALQRLSTVLGEASKTLPQGFAIVATSTSRPGATVGGSGAPSMHSTGEAIDFQIVGPQGRIPNRGADTTGLYGQVAADAYLANQRLFPGTPLASGVNFGVTAGSREADLMHLDTGPQRGNLGVPLPQLAEARRPYVAAALGQPLSATVAGPPTPAGFVSPTAAAATAAGRAPQTTVADAVGQPRSARIQGPPNPAENIYVAPTPDQIDRLNKFGEADQREIEVLKNRGVAERLARAELEGRNRAIDAGAQGAAIEAEAQRARAVELEKVNIEVRKAAQAQDEETTGLLKSAEGYQKSAAEGTRLAEVARARADAINTGADADKLAAERLSAGAAAAIQAGAQQARAMDVTITASARLADATAKGAASEHAAELQNQAVALTHDALTKAIAAHDQAVISGNPALVARTELEIKEAQALTERTAAQLRANDALQTAVARERATNVLQDNAQLLQAEVAMQGQSSAEISRQIDYLRAKQEIAKVNVDLSTEEGRRLNAANEAYLAQVASVGRLTVGLDEARAATQRIQDAVRSVAETISSSLVQSISDAFDGKKVDDWGTKLKNIIKQIISQIAEFAFIKPAIGTVLAALGQNQAAQQFGSFSGLLGGGGGTSATGAAGTSSGGGLNLGTIGQVGGLAKDLGGGSIFGEGGFSGFLNNIGGSLGFAVPASAGSLGSGASVAASLGSTPFSALPGANVASFLTGGAGPSAATAASSGGLFGATTFSSFLGGAGAGFGAGSLLNSLIGGNQVTGSVGSGLGSLAGAAIGSIIPGIGTLIGGLLGGAGGGLLGGMFGNNKPSNMASGSLIDIASGRVSGFTSSGNQQNDQTVNQITAQVSEFTKTVQRLTGGTATGAINVQAGTRDGIKVSTSGGLGSAEVKAADAATAINEIELKIAQSLTGISATLKTVLAQTTDPQQIEANVQFAASYDDLKKASDSAFSSISTDIKTVGPFQQAFEQLGTIFSDLADKATQFGLSLAPVNAGLAEATRRLRDDFSKALDQAINAATPGGDNINQLTAVGQAFRANTREAAAIGLGGDATTTAKIAQLEVVQAQGVLSGATADQLQKIIDALEETNPEIAAMAREILATGSAATGAAAALRGTAEALNALSAGVKAIEDLALNLKTGQLSGLPPAAAANAANVAYQTQYQAAVAAGENVTGAQLADLAKLGQSAVEASINAYGEAPQTANLRRGILAGLDLVTARSGSSGNLAQQASRATASPVLTGSAQVQAAQAAAAAAAIPSSASSAAAPAPAPAASPAAEPPAPASPAAEAPAAMATPDLSTTVARYIAGDATADEQTRVVAALNSGQLPPAQAENVQAAYARLYQYTAAAAGSESTPPGPILVGEKGPEWMWVANDNAATALPPAASAARSISGGGRKLVSEAGPEAASQPGGAIILPFAMGTSAGTAGAAPMVASAGIRGSGDAGTERGWAADKAAGTGHQAVAQPRAVTGNGWQLVGKGGPEIITQAGGAIILPFPQTPRDYLSALASRSTSETSTTLDRQSVDRTSSERSFAMGTEITAGASPMPPMLSHLPAFATGTTGTPSGQIIVGERGMEWMLPKPSNLVLPEMPDRLAPPKATEWLGVRGGRETAGDAPTTQEIKELRKQVSILTRVIQGGQQQDTDGWAEQNAHLAGIVQNTGSRPTMLSRRAIR